jgi:hypothetical protein
MKSPTLNELKVLFALLLLLVSHSTLAQGRSSWVGTDLSGKPCTGKPGGRGVDYRTPAGKEKLKIVEKVHFTEGVRTLTSVPRGTGSFYSNVDYTLRKSPNHHKALNTLISLFDRMGARDKRITTPPECYFQKALAYYPDDALVPSLFGLYLHRRGRLEQAVEHYERALSISGGLVETHYNLGLALVALRKYEDAVPHAEQAYAGGYPLPGLRDQLKRAGFDVKGVGGATE